MGIKSILLGYKVVLNDSFFGKIESNRTRNKTAKQLDWHFRYQINGFNLATEIIAEGNYLGINPAQKQVLQDFITNFSNKYSAQLDALIKENNQFSQLENWRNEYYISGIHPMLGSPDVSFDIAFETYNKQKLFVVQLLNETLIELEILN